MPAFPWWFHPALPCHQAAAADPHLLLHRNGCRFHAWPEEALVSVARRFLSDVPLASEELREQIAQHMAFAHQSVTAASHKCAQAGAAAAALARGAGRSLALNLPHQPFTAQVP